MPSSIWPVFAPLFAAPWEREMMLSIIWIESGWEGTFAPDESKHRERRGSKRRTLTEMREDGKIWIRMARGDQCQNARRTEEVANVFKSYIYERPVMGNRHDYYCRLFHRV